VAEKRKIVIIDGHPDPDNARYCHALAEAYQTGAMAAGHDAELIRISTIEFPLLRSVDEYKQGPTPEPLVPARDAILGADHVVLIYPLWLGTLPALLKALLEQIFHHDIAFEKAGPNDWPTGRLKGKSARVIVTMGMPALAYRWWYGAHSLKSLERNILKFIGFKPVRDTVFGMVEMVSSEKRQAWLKKVEEFGSKAI